MIGPLGLMATRERERESAIPGCESCEGGPRPGVGARTAVSIRPEG